MGGTLSQSQFLRHRVRGLLMKHSFTYEGSFESYITTCKVLFWLKGRKDVSVQDRIGYVQASVQAVDDLLLDFPKDALLVEAANLLSDLLLIAEVNQSKATENVKVAGDTPPDFFEEWMKKEFPDV